MQFFVLKKILTAKDTALSLPSLLRSLLLRVFQTTSNAAVKQEIPKMHRTLCTAIYFSNFCCNPIIVRPFCILISKLLNITSFELVKRLLSV